MHIKFRLILYMLVCVAITKSVHAEFANKENIDLVNAEVIVLSSGNPYFRAMTNTDERGGFAINGIPAGGIVVIVRRNGVDIARGSGIIEKGFLNEASVLEIGLVPVQPALKSLPKRK